MPQITNSVSNATYPSTIPSPATVMTNLFFSCVSIGASRALGADSEELGTDFCSNQHVLRHVAYITESWMVEDGNFSLIGKLIIMLINCMPHNINSVSNTTHLLAHPSPATIMTNPIITSLSKQAARNRQKTETAEGGGAEFS